MGTPNHWFCSYCFSIDQWPLQVLKMEIATISEAYVPLTFYGKDTSMYVQSYIYLYLFIFIYTYFIHICIVFIHRLYICVYIHIYIHRYGYTRVTWITNKTSWVNTRLTGSRKAQNASGWLTGRWWAWRSHEQSGRLLHRLGRMPWPDGELRRMDGWTCWKPSETFEWIASGYDEHSHGIDGP